MTKRWLSLLAQCVRKMNNEREENMEKFHSFSQEEIQALSVPMKLGLLATVNSQGLPHLTLLSTLQPFAPDKMSWGQFVEGLSKDFIRRNPKTGFMIMTLDKTTWRGKAHFTGDARSGPQYDMYNNIPMFRYNAYFGVHTVFYMDLVEHYGRQPLPMGGIIFGAVLTMFNRLTSPKPAQTSALSSWAFNFMNTLDNLKFLSYVDKDGYPVIIPAIQTQALTRSRLVFAGLPFSDELAVIPSGIPLAVYGMSLKMESVLMRGKYLGMRKRLGLPFGEVELDWVYNAMPPVPGQIYPPIQVEKVTNFI